MMDMQARWFYCHKLAEQLKRRSLQLPPVHYEPPLLNDADKATAEAIEDLKRRSGDLRQRYGL